MADGQMKPEEELTGLALLRKPFAANQISKLPKPTKRQTDEVKADFKKGIRCQVCGGCIIRKWSTLTMLVTPP